MYFKVFTALVVAAYLENTNITFSSEINDFSSDSLESLSARIQYSFKDTSLLKEALVHPSMRSTKQTPDPFQRLEFLGDSVLNLTISSLLFGKLPLANEHRLTEERKKYTNNKFLALQAKKIDLINYVKFRTDKVKHPERGKNKIAATAYEALIGGIFLDGGIEAAKAFISQQYSHLLVDKEITAVSLSTPLKTENFQTSPSISSQLSLSTPVITPLSNQEKLQQLLKGRSSSQLGIPHQIKFENENGKVRIKLHNAFIEQRFINGNSGPTIWCGGNYFTNYVSSKEEAAKLALEYLDSPLKFLEANYKDITYDIDRKVVIVKFPPRKEWPIKR